MTTINTRPEIAAALEAARVGTAHAETSPLFADALSAQAAKIGVTTPLAAPAIVNPALLRDIVEQDGRRRDRDARERGRSLLDRLASLRRGMLLSGDEETDLAQLDELLGAMPQAADPDLADLVREIAVRATVELCKRRLA